MGKEPKGSKASATGPYEPDAVLLAHPCGTWIRIIGAGEGFRVAVVERGGREVKRHGPVGLELMRCWYRGWTKEGFAHITEGN